MFKSITILLVLMLTCPVIPGAADALALEEVEVLLKGHDDPLVGYLRQISDARYLLQGPNFYYESPAIRSSPSTARRRFPVRCSATAA